MKLPRRKFLHLAAGAAALPAVSRFAFAQAYPSRPVRLIVTVAAGSSPDIVARLIGQWLTERLGQPFVIENRPHVADDLVGFRRGRGVRHSLISYWLCTNRRQAVSFFGRVVTVIRVANPVRVASPGPPQRTAGRGAYSLGRVLINSPGMSAFGQTRH
jgi:hypothetical protein